MGFAGFDFVIIDQEHGPISIETAQNMIRAAESVNISPIIRVAKNDESLILRALDIGAQGVKFLRLIVKMMQSWLLIRLNIHHRDAAVFADM